jgi:crotonobetainyl-CoA:carnitine CoA-transferase CaiB-like acyl-CoA transferase
LTDEQPADTGAASGALRDIRVVDLSRVLAGPYCTQLLGDHGAEVVKVEPPTGDETRNWGPPFYPDGLSAYYAGVNRNKANICLDLSTEPGRAVLADLLADADVLVENFKLGTMAKWGLDYDGVLAKRYPRLVYCRITGYGSDGPLAALPGYDAVLQAFSGMMSINGQPDGPPLRVGVPIVDLATAIAAFAGILLALHERSSSGRGQLVDCSLLETAISLLHPQAPNYFASGRVPGRTGTAHPSIAPYETFPTRTGPLFVTASTDRQFLGLCEALGRGELATDERFRRNRDRVVNLPDLRAELRAGTEQRDREELCQELLRRGVPSAPVHDIAEALADAQVEHREMVVRRDGYRGLGIPIKLPRTPGSVRTVPGARGADTVAVLSSLGYPRERIEELLVAGVVQQAPAVTERGEHPERR